MSFSYWTGTIYSKAKIEILIENKIKNKEKCASAVW
jgi:hypothetical protein